MSEAHDQLLIEFEQQERWRDLLGEVLAVLNGDGGHYQTEHGAGRAAIEGIRRYYQLLARLDALEAAVLDIDAHATGLDQDEDGFTTGGYIVSVGALHRALGVVGHAARKCSPGALCPLCGQAKALADAADSALRGRVVNNWLTGGETVCLACGQLPKSGMHDDGCWVAELEAALRAYREANHA